MSSVADLDSSCKWVLKGEGRANAVFGYSGCTASLVGMVLRVRKLPGASDKKPLHCELDSQIWGNDISEMDDVIPLLAPWLDRRFMSPGVSAKLDPEFVAGLEAQYAAQDSQGPVSKLSARCQLLPDHTIFQGTLTPEAAWPALCVEIKPKWGALPSSPALAPDNIKRHISRYQLQQRLKLSQGKIAKISTYDPLDLFSTQPHRVQQAVLALFQNPQNNLRLFLHGHPLQLQSDNSLEAAAAAIAAAFGPSFSAMPALQAVQALTGALQSILQQEGLLSSLLQIQQLEHDIEAIYPLYLHMCQGMTDLTHSVPSNQDSKHSRPGHFDDMTQQNDDARLHMQQLHELPHTQQLRCLRNYLLAATAKDCSIMITMQVLPEDEPVQGRGSISIHGCQKAVTYKVAVVDLDVKAAFKIISHYQLDCQLQAVNRM